MTEEDLTWGGEHTIQYTDEVLQNCTPKVYIILLTNVAPINSIKKKTSSPHTYFGIWQLLDPCYPILCNIF